MQVISGKYRARRLISPDSARPTLQRIKISTFSLIQELLFDGMKVLDLFAGSGALGIECISRGAEKACFVEKDKKAVDCIIKNLHEIDKTFYSIMGMSYNDALNNLARNSESFDIIFLDPPYEENFYIAATELIQRYNLCRVGGIIVIESLKDKKPNISLDGFDVYKSRDYGITNITILIRKN